MATIKETIQDLFELDKMSPEEADEMVDRLAKLIFQAVLMRVLPELSEEDFSEYERIVDSETGGEEMFAFLNKKIPDFSNIIEEESEALRSELAGEFKSAGLSDTQKSGIDIKELKKINEGDLSGIDLFIDTLLSGEINESLELIEQTYSQINSENPNEAETYILLLLESFWNFFQSQLSIIEKADFQQGLSQMQNAYQGFVDAKLKDLQVLAEGLQLYFSAIVDIKDLNLNSGLEKIKRAKEHFVKIDKYGQSFSQQVEALEAESLFISGVKFIVQLDYENGQIAIEKASITSKRIALNYFEKDSQEFDLFIGLSFVYSSFSHFFIQIAKLNSFTFEYFDYTENEARDNSLEAIRHLSNSVELSEVTRVNLNISKGINLLSEVVFSIGQCMYSLLTSKKNDINFATKPMKKSIKNAIKFFTTIGENGIVFIRICKQIESQVLNIDKFFQFEKAIAQSGFENSEIIENTRSFVKDGKNEKAIDYLVSHSIDYDLFNDTILLKSRYSRLKQELILGLISNEEFRVEENKFSKSILGTLESFELKN